MILFLAHRLPWPPDRGDRIRSHHLLKALAKIAPVHLGCFVDGKDEQAGVKTLAPLLASAHVEPLPRSRLAAALHGLAKGRAVSVELYDSATMHDWVRRTLDQHEISCVFAFSGQMAQFVPSGVRRFVMDFVDVDSAKFAAYAEQASWPLGAVHAREATLLAAFERDTARRADMSLFVSEAEAALFRERSGEPAQMLGNGVDLAYFDPAAVEPPCAPDPLIVFTGQMDYAPNIEAVTAFARTTLPRIRAKRPEARFAIVGRAPVASVRALAREPGVTVTGGVDDVRPWLAAATVVVAPLRIARGVQNKVLEAMAMARPVVASLATHRGIDARPGHDLLVADGAEAEAYAVLSLLDDPARARTLGNAARQRMVERYHWDAQLAGLRALVMPEPALGLAA